MAAFAPARLITLVFCVCLTTRSSGVKTCLRGVRSSTKRVRVLYPVGAHLAATQADRRMQDKSKRMCEFFTEWLKESAHTNPREGGAENGLDVHAYRCV